MRPDCDAIGSELGLALALRSLGKTVRIVNGDAVPPHIAFIDPNHDVQVLGRDVAAADVTCDVHVVLDTSAWAQLGPMADVVRNSAARKINIDHHVSQDDMGAVVFKDTTSESTGRLVLQAIDALGVKLTPEMAMPLFAAIATDTGWFRFSSVDGGDVCRRRRGWWRPARSRTPSSQNCTSRTRWRGLRLQGRILSNVKSHLGGRLLSTAITQADLKAVGAEATDTEDVINRLLGVAGVEVALLFLELGPQETKVSLRSRSSFDVNAVAGAIRRRRTQGGLRRALSRAAGEAEPAVIAAVSAAMEGDESRA